MDLKRKQREGVDLAKQPATEKAADAVTRPTPPYADMTFGLGRKGQPAICMTHHAAMEYCRWLSAKTGKLYRLPTEAEWEYACRAGTTTAYSFGDDPDEARASTPGTSTTPRSPSRSARRSRIPGASTTCTATSAEWCLDHYVADIYSTFADGPARARARSSCPTPRNIPTWPGAARGTTTPTGSAARPDCASNLEWSVQDPQRPQSIWWHTDATFVGFRVVRAARGAGEPQGPEVAGRQGQGDRSRATPRRATRSSLDRDASSSRSRCDRPRLTRRDR